MLSFIIRRTDGKCFSVRSYFCPLKLKLMFLRKHPLGHCGKSSSGICCFVTTRFRINTLRKDCFLWPRAGSLFVPFLLSEKEERRFFAYFLSIPKEESLDLFFFFDTVG